MSNNAASVMHIMPFRTFVFPTLCPGDRSLNRRGFSGQSNNWESFTSLNAPYILTGSGQQTRPTVRLSEQRDFCFCFKSGRELHLFPQTDRQDLRSEIRA